MKEIDVIRALTALAQEIRLRVFRVLVVAGNDGLTPGTLAEQLGVASNTLSFHLKELVHSGLISQQRQGRNLIYRASFTTMNELLRYLTENCCQGANCMISSNSKQPLNVLFLCTHNSARSILAEALLNAIGQGRFQAFSAGSSPHQNQQPHPLGLQVLQRAGIAVEGLRSKSWDEFAMTSSPKMDLIITVCDNAAGEACPSWPGHPATAHWGYADPSEGNAPDAQKLEAFRSTLYQIKRRLELLINLPTDKLEKAVLETTARELAEE